MTAYGEGPYGGGGGTGTDDQYEAALWATAQAQAINGAKVARVRIVLGWPDVTSASITRVHADGSTTPLRNAEPTAMSGQTVAYDHECPLDQPVSYIATSPDAPSVIQISNVVSCASGGAAWFGHPGRPSTDLATIVTGLDVTFPGRRGVFLPIGRSMPIIVSDVRGAAQGTVTVQVDDEAGWRRIRSMIADGVALMLRMPETWSGDCWYASLADVQENRYSGIAYDPLRRYPMAFSSASRPTGIAEGAVGLTCADVAALYATCGDLAASGKSCIDLAIDPTP